MTTYYMAIIGTAELCWFGTCDNRAKEKVNRWVRRYWKGFVARSNPGSMAYAINTEERVEASLYGTECDDTEVIPCVMPRLVDRFYIPH